jgi:hypothetical protein
MIELAGEVAKHQVAGPAVGSETIAQCGRMTVVEYLCRVRGGAIKEGNMDGKVERQTVDLSVLPDLVVFIS